jgi:hypothetical protein
LLIWFDITAPDLYDGVMQAKMRRRIRNDLARRPVIFQHPRIVAVAILTGLTITSVSGQLDNASFYTRHFRVAEYPNGMAYDGANVWVTNYSSVTGQAPVITKLRGSDGALLGRYPIPLYSASAVFDGSYIWLTDHGAGFTPDTLTRLRPDGTVEGVYPAGQFAPSGIIFDGENIWSISSIGHLVVKIRASDAAIIATYTIDSLGSFYLTYDGANIWVTNYLNDTVTKLRASDGVVLGTFDGGHSPAGITFDGGNIWVASYLDSSLRKFDLDGTLLQVVRLQFAPFDITFDGSHIWACAEDTPIENRGKIIQLSLDGRVLRTIPTGRQPSGILFDGDNIWCSNYLNSTVTKVVHSH